MMTQLDKIKKLNEILLQEMPEYRIQAMQINADDYKQQRLFLRSLMNLREPMPISEEFLNLQDDFLTQEALEKGIVHVQELVPVVENICIWQGDITRLDADAIVNAGNTTMLGCFLPCHKCIDNAIHSSAGLQLRDICFQMMLEQGHEEAIGSAKITKAYNLPSKYIIHTVGPEIYDAITKYDKLMLASCYTSCLQVASEKDLESIAFCCISTGELSFPKQLASEIAVHTVKTYLRQNPETSLKKIIFNVFKHEDYEIYKEVLQNLQ